MKAWYKKSGLILIGLAGLLWGLYRAVQVQIRTAEEQVNAISDLKDPSPFRAALLGHLDKTHISLQGYMRSHDASLPAQIAQGQIDFEKSVPEFQRQSPRLLPEKAKDSILKDYGVLKDLMERLLHTNEEQAVRWQSSEAQFKQMLFILTQRLRPLIRKSQPEGEERLAMVLKLENQVRTWQQDMNQAWAEPTVEGLPRLIAEDQDRGNSLLESYEKLALLSAERRNLRELRQLWIGNADLSREIFTYRTTEKQTNDLMGLSRQMLVTTLNRLLPALEPAVIENEKASLMQTMRLRMAAAGLLCLAGLALAIGAIILIYRERPRQATHSKTDHPTLVMTVEGTLRDWSPEAEALYGYAAAEVIGKSLALLFVSETEIEHLYQELRTGHKTEFEARHKKKSAVEMSVHMAFRSSLDAHGKVDGIQMFCTRR